VPCGEGLPLKLTNFNGKVLAGLNTAKGEKEVIEYLVIKYVPSPDWWTVHGYYGSVCVIARMTGY